jgi:phosphoenolpyruvate synthase/pyruvate phosphate dikinase
MILGFHRDAPVDIAGRKGHNLSRMWQAGLPVPPGFCITCDEIHTVGSSQLNRALAELGATHFAVRSSAIQEDTTGASFAGMLLSRLNITPDGVFPALQEIRDSILAPAALGYSQRLNVRTPPLIAAIVQTFLAAEASGVLFMRDPGTDAGHFVVEGCWGLGPGVAEGLVRPDRWIVSAEGVVISSQIADKDIAIVPDPHEGTTQIPVDPSCRRRPCLGVESLQQLSRMAAECERLFGSPQDIEWAVRDNRVWLLQSRPITF